jgi:hypothetical protein
MKGLRRTRLHNARFRKPVLAVQTVGKRNFWLGLLIGIGMSIMLAFMFNYMRELLRVAGFMSNTLYEPPQSEVDFFNWFFVLLSGLLGLGYTLWYWLLNARGRRSKLVVIATALIFFFWLILLVVSRFGWLLAFLPYNMWGYENDLLLAKDYKWLFILILIYLFLQFWQIVETRFRAGRFKLYSLFALAAVAILLLNISLPDRSMVNRAFYKQFEEQRNYSEKVRAEAKANYNIQFDSTTVYLLDRQNSRRCLEQVRAVKNAFNHSNPVALDTIVLARIIQHNAKRGLRLSCYYKCWDYPPPLAIYYQLTLADSASSAFVELISLLKVQFDLLLTPLEPTVQDDIDFSLLDQDRLYVAQSAPLTIRHQMVVVRNLILADERFTNYHYLFHAKRPLPPEYFDSAVLTSYEAWFDFYLNGQ